jgi:hypothetical protein
MASLKDWPRKLYDYRKAPQGFFQFCEENIHIPIYPEGSDIAQWIRMGDLPDETNPRTDKSYSEMWEAQKEICIEALRMENKRFVYRLLVFCWMRGEGKSLLACLVQIWKFFCWPRQAIMLGANSKDQIKFVHYDIIRDIILHSPRLLYKVGGKKNVKEKEIVIRDERGGQMSILRAISSFSGIVSNITGYTFSEIFDMKNPRFFVQLDGSVRNIPNALGVIDSTVSDKLHVFYRLYEGHRTGKSKGVFFSYRHSRDAVMEDYWNPHMDQSQLSDYQVKFPFGEFERYFQNLWSAGFKQIFTDEMLEAMGYIGMDGKIGNQYDMLEVLKKKNRLLDKAEEMAGRGVSDAVIEADIQSRGHMERFRSIEELYYLKTPLGMPRAADMDDLFRLGDFYDTEWCVLGGIDRADPMKVRTAARTVVSVVAKGLVGSRSNPFMQIELGGIPQYIYLLLNLVHVESSSLEDIKDALKASHEELDGLDVICGERWGIWDLEPWCEDLDIEFQAIFPTYDRQKEAFSEMFIAVQQGRFKAPPLSVPGSKSEDMLREEAAVFDHDMEKRWFGSPEKQESRGVQDDSVFAVAWSMYGGRMKGVDDFRSRKSGSHFGIMFANKDLLAMY